MSGHQRTDDTGIPYTVGDYEIHKEIPEQIRILFNLAIYAGLRKGEILALEFSDINHETDVVSITKAATVVKGKQTCKKPKTKMSTRTITIPHHLTLRILELRKSREQLKADLADFWQGGDWIFIQDNGRMMNYSTPYQALQDVLQRYNADRPPEDQLPKIPLFPRLSVAGYVVKVPFSISHRRKIREDFPAVNCTCVCKEKRAH